MAYIGRGINSGDAVSDHLTGSGATVYTLTYDTTTDGVVLSLAGGVGTVFLNTTSGEMFSCTDATAGANVWVNIGEGTGSIPVTYTSATGGTITTDGSFKVHTFTTSGTFTPTLGSFSSGAVVEVTTIVQQEEEELAGTEQQLILL